MWNITVHNSTSADFASPRIAFPASQWFMSQWLWWKCFISWWKCFISCLLFKHKDASVTDSVIIIIFVRAASLEDFHYSYLKRIEHIEIHFHSYQLQFYLLQGLYGFTFTVNQAIDTRKLYLLCLSTNVPSPLLPAYSMIVSILDLSIITTCHSSQWGQPCYWNLRN